MILKHLDYPEKIYYYNALGNRIKLTKEQSDDYMRHQYGFAGESYFFDKLEHLNATVLWDITLDVKFGGKAQYDFLVLHGDTIVHYDIKNYKGTFRMEGNQLVSNFNRKYDNPEDQRIRSEQILKTFVNNSPFYKEVESYIVFIHPEFHFDGIAGEKSWIFLSQLSRHLKQYEEEDYRQDSNHGLGKHILKHHHPLTHLNVPIRTPIEDIRAGNKCPSCRDLVEIVYNGGKYFTCPKCNTKHQINEILLFNLTELAILKNDHFSVSEAMNWCDNPSRSVMHRVLQKHFIKHGHTKGATYEMVRGNRRK